jgi:hypothetical protein
VLYANSDRDFDAVSARLSEFRPGGLIVSSDTFFATHGEQLAALTPATRCPPSISPVTLLLPAG